VTKTTTNSIQARQPNPTGVIKSIQFTWFTVW